MQTGTSEELFTQLAEAATVRELLLAEIKFAVLDQR